MLGLGGGTVEGSERLGPTPDWHGQTKWLSLQRRTSVHVDKQEGPWKTSSSDVGKGPKKLIALLQCSQIHRAISPSFWAGNRPLIISNGRRIWKLIEASLNSIRDLHGRLDST